MKAGGILVGFGQCGDGRFCKWAPDESQARGSTVGNCDARMPGEIAYQWLRRAIPLRYRPHTNFLLTERFMEQP